MVGVFEPGSVCLVHRARLQFLKEAPGERTLCMGRGRKVPVLSTKYAEFVCLLSSRLGTNFSGVGSWLILIFITFVWDRASSGSSLLLQMAKLRTKEKNGESWLPRA